GATLELVEVLERAHPRVLRHVLGLAVVADDRPRDPVEALVVAAHEELEERGLAGADAGDDVLVSEGARRGNGRRGSGRHIPTESGAPKRFPGTEPAEDALFGQEVTT